MYYKSYIERGGKPGEFELKNYVRGNFQHKYGDKSPNEDLWQQFIGGFDSGNQYMPCRNKYEENDLIPEGNNSSRNRRGLGKTDYKPDFDEYVRNRVQDRSIEREAKTVLDWSKSAEDSKQQRFQEGNTPLNVYKKIKQLIDSDKKQIPEFSKTNYQNDYQQDNQTPMSILKQRRLEKAKQSLSTPGKKVQFSPQFKHQTEYQGFKTDELNYYPKTQAFDLEESKQIFNTKKQTQLDQIKALYRKKLIPKNLLETNLFDKSNLDQSPPKFSKSLLKLPDSKYPVHKIRKVYKDPISRGVGKKIEANNSRWGDYSKIIEQYEKAFQEQYQPFCQSLFTENQETHPYKELRIEPYDYPVTKQMYSKIKFDKGVLSQNIVDRKGQSMVKKVDTYDPSFSPVKVVSCRDRELSKQKKEIKKKEKELLARHSKKSNEVRNKLMKDYYND